MATNGITHDDIDRAKRLIAEGHHEELLSVRVVARVLGVSVNTVYDYTRGPSPTLPAHRFGRSRRPRVRIDCQTLHRFLHGARPVGIGG